MTGKRIKVGPVEVNSYRAFLVEPSRPPSKGGNTRAWHQHSFEIDGERYSFLALGAKRWVFTNDTVEFEWHWDESGLYRNIDPATVRTMNARGETVVRGERGTKKWRSAPARMPGSRREQRD